MIGQVGPATAPAPGFSVFWAMLGRIVAKLMGDRTHGNVTLVMKDGVIVNIRVETNYPPNGLPRI